MKIRALRPFRYASRALQPGEVFEASDRDAKLLKRVGRAADHTDPEPLRARAAEPEPIAQTAAVEQPEPVAEESPRAAIRYRRRDMTAEEVE